MARLLLLLTILALAASCESDADKARRLAAEQALAERALFTQRRTEVLASPGRFLTYDKLGYFDKGIINDYRQLISVTITNSAAVPVVLKKGRVIWLSDSGDELGTSPLTFTGTLSPGSSATFSTATGNLTSGTIQGQASKVRIEFTEIDVPAPRQP
jgi:hypothetical protein